MAESLADLPHNVLSDVLARLPLRTLFAAKCVCKTFLHLISPDNCHFTSLHSAFAHQILIFQFEERPTELFHLFDSELDVAIGRPQKLPLGMPATQNSISKLPRWSLYSLVNSCNGLLYFTQNDHFDLHSLVCNPVTNEYIRIPSEDLWLESQTDGPICSWLGFSPVSNRYKILKCYGPLNQSSVSAAKVLEVGSNSWRDIVDTHPRQRERGGRAWTKTAYFTYLDGVLYCLDPNSLDVLDFFDCDKEVFGVIQMPAIIGTNDYGNDSHYMAGYGCLGVLGNRLCLSLPNFSIDIQVNIWVRENSGNQQNWTREIVIDTSALPSGWCCSPLHILRSGEILMVTDGFDIVCYDPRSKSLKHLGFEVQLMKSQDLPRVVSLTPSFFSLKDTLNVDQVISNNDRGGHVMQLVINIKHKEGNTKMCCLFLWLCVTSVLCLIVVRLCLFDYCV